MPCSDLPGGANGVVRRAVEEMGQGQVVIRECKISQKSDCLAIQIDTTSIGLIMQGNLAFLHKTQAPGSFVQGQPHYRCRLLDFIFQQADTLKQFGYQRLPEL